MKLIITVKRKENVVDEAIEEMKKEVGTVKLKVFAAVYKSKMRGLYYMIRNGVSRFITEEGSDWFTAIEEGDEGYIKQRYKTFEDFMYGEEDVLKQNKEYHNFKSDRIVKKMTKYIGRALGGGKVIDFFNRVGIEVNYKIED